MFGMLGVFSEFEREMIQERVRSGLARVKDAIERDGKFTTRAGKVRKRLGRPSVGLEIERRVRAELTKGTGILKTAAIVGVGSGTVQRIRREMAEV